MATSAIEWTDATWNPVTGCDRVSAGCDNCLAPETPVLMADMSWQPIGKLEVGDVVVSFTEAPALGQNRLYEPATVLHAWSTRAAAVELSIGGRTLVASEDHRFLSAVRPYWREAMRLTLQSAVVDIGVPTWLPSADSEPYLAGYLAGAIAGDGTMRIDGSGKGGTKQSYLRVAVLSTDLPILERMARAFAVLGCTDIAIRSFDGGAGGPVAPGQRRAQMSKIETRRRSNLIAVRDASLPERDDPNWQAGFLAGFFDTDGCYSGSNLRFNQTKDNGLLDAVHRYTANLGFRSCREDFRSATGRSERVMGNIEEKIRFLSTIEPALTRKAADFYGRRFPGKSTTTVDGVRRVGIRDLVDIETSSGTFIAAGLATHNCYALNFAKRLKAMGQPKYQVDGDPRTSGPGFGVALHPQVLDEPSRWRKARFVFVNSMGDLFHPDVPDQFIWQVFGTMATSPQHRFQILTKRPQRMAALLQTWKLALDGLPGAPTLPLPNVWLGTSIEDDRYTWRADHLRVTPAAIRFLSIEPLLGAVPSLDLTGIDWVIAGGESGHGARAAEEAWVRELRDRCLASGVAFFFKQWGGRTPKAGGRELDGRAWDEMPA